MFGSAIFTQLLSMGWNVESIPVVVHALGIGSMLAVSLFTENKNLVYLVCTVRADTSSKYHDITHRHSWSLKSVVEFTFQLMVDHRSIMNFFELTHYRHFKVKVYSRGITCHGHESVQNPFKCFRSRCFDQGTLHTIR